MSKKIDRAKHGPSWAEVILGAVLSAVLGVILGALLLILRPVVVAKEAPKEVLPNTVYYVEGSRDTNKARQAAAKRQSFVQGQSVTVTEDELNALVGPAAGGAAPAGGKAAEKAKTADKAKGAEKGKDESKAAPAGGGSDDLLATGVPNFRINDGMLQVGIPVTVNALGLGQKVIVQTRGKFAKDGDIFVYQPDEMLFGSCPVHRLPFLASYARNKFLNSQPVPEDIKSAWAKLANVAIEGNALKLTMP